MTGTTTQIMIELADLVLRRDGKNSIQLAIEDYVRERFGVRVGLRHCGSSAHAIRRLVFRDSTDFGLFPR